LYISQQTLYIKAVIRKLLFTVLYKIFHISYMFQLKDLASLEVNETLFWDGKDVLPMLKRNLLHSYFSGNKGGGWTRPELLR
jgi:hypothetical protein